LRVAGRWARRPEQGLLGDVLGEALAQEGFVRGVLQEAADQIAHPRDQLAEGRVHPHALAHLHQDIVDGLPHAVEHLELHGAVGQAQVARGGLGEGKAPHVVGPHGGAQVAVARVLQQAQQAPLEAGVGLPLLREDGRLPSPLLGHGHLGVPVRPLHQTNPHGGAAASRPFPQGRQVPLALLQVRLKGHAEFRVVPELVLHEDLLHDPEDEVLHVVVLHVHGDVRPAAAGP